MVTNLNEPRHRRSSLAVRSMNPSLGNARLDHLREIAGRPHLTISGLVRQAIRKLSLIHI